MESWITFNANYYAYLADVLIKRYPDRDETGSRFIAIEMFKLLHEIIEALGMWYYSLRKTAFQPTIKLHQIYNKYQATPTDFNGFSKELKKQDVAGFLKRLGVSDKIRPRGLDDTAFNELIQAMIEYLERVFSFKILDNRTMTSMYYKSKHGGNFFIDSDTKSFDVGILIYNNEKMLYDNPHFSAKYDLVKQMKSAITEQCTRVLQNLIILRYETDKLNGNLLKPYISY